MAFLSYFRGLLTGGWRWVWVGDGCKAGLKKGGGHACPPLPWL